MSAPPFHRYDSNYSKFYKVDTANCYLDTPENKDPLAEYNGGSMQRTLQNNTAGFLCTYPIRTM